MRYPNFPGVGKRIKERLLALGYMDADGQPDIARFIREKQYDSRNFYPWANKDRTPSGANLDRLAADLECSPAWLLFGVDVPVIAGGSNLLEDLLAVGKRYYDKYFRNLPTAWWAYLTPQPHYVRAA